MYWRNCRGWWRNSPAVAKMLMPNCTADATRRSRPRFQFEQAQRNDFIAQTIDCVVTALGRLAAADVRESPALSPHDLAALYVSEDQRRVHQAVVRRFSLAGPSDRDGVESRDRERRGK